MAEFLGYQFNRTYGNPIETNRKVTTIAERDGIANTVRYEGMLCYVTSENKDYQLRGGIDNSNWVEVAGSDITPSLVPIPIVYPDLSGLIAGQSNQNENYIYEVTDASGFTGISTSRAFVKYLGTTLGTEADYTVISKEEDLRGVEQYANLASFPVTGGVDILYVALDTNLTYIWNGSAYVQVGGSAPIPITYADTTALIAGQSNQNENYIYEITDASGFGLTGVRRAKYLGTTNGDATDYSFEDFNEQITKISSISNTLTFDNNKVLNFVDKEIQTTDYNFTLDSNNSLAGNVIVYYIQANGTNTFNFTTDFLIVGNILTNGGTLTNGNDYVFTFIYMGDIVLVEADIFINVSITYDDVVFANTTNATATGNDLATAPTGTWNASGNPSVKYGVNTQDFVAQFTTDTVNAQGMFLSTTNNYGGNLSLLSHGVFVSGTDEYFVKISGTNNATGVTRVVGDILRIKINESGGVTTFSYYYERGGNEVSLGSHIITTQDWFINYGSNNTGTLFDCQTLNGTTI